MAPVIDRNLQRRRRSMPQMLADDIRMRIVAGEILPDEPLPPEKELMETYGVSRPTLREALRILEAESLVETIRGAKGGVIVRAPDAEVVIRQAGVLLQLSGATFGDVYRARAPIECSAVRVLATGARSADLKELRGIIEDGRACVGKDPDRFGSVAGQFHRAVVHRSRNITMSFIVDMLAALTDATYQQKVNRLDPGPREEAMLRAIRSWEKLVRLVEARDAGAAETHWARHLAAVGGSIVDGEGDVGPLAAEMLPGAAP